MTKELDCLITEIVQKATTAELNQIISAFNFQLQQREEKEIQKAKQAFIKAYTEFRQLAPYDECYIDIYDNDGEFWDQRELFDMMDEKFLRGE
jgi:hypothetical protein